MNELELKELWQSTNKRLEMSLHISNQQTEDIMHLKLQNFLSSMKPSKIFTILVGMVWVGILGPIVARLFLFDFHNANLFFLCSAVIQVIVTAIALIIYIYQLVTIYLVDITEPILKTQEKIASLKTTTLWVTRILFLQLPIWTTFYWNESMLQSGNWFLWIIQGTVTLSFACLALWLFFNIKYENRNKKWFKLIFNGREWTPLMKSMELLEQVKEYR